MLRGSPRAYDFVLPDFGRLVQLDARDLEWLLALDLVKRGEQISLASHMLIWPPWYGHPLRRLLRVDLYGIEFGGNRFHVVESSKKGQVEEWGTEQRSSWIQ